MAVSAVLFSVLLRNVLTSKSFGINDLLDAEYMAYMLKYDSTHGRFDGTVEVKDGHLVVNGKTIRVTAEKDPANLKWNEIGVDVVAEVPVSS